MNRALIFGLMILMLLGLAQAATISSYVQDNAQVFKESEKSALESQLRALESKTNGVQFVVFIEKNIPKDSSIEERSLSIAEENKIGKKDADNGVLFYLATEDRQFRWEVGYGVEDILNAALLGRLSREVMVPKFQSGDYAGGIADGAAMVEKILAGSEDKDVLKITSPPKYDWSPLIILFFFFVIFVAVSGPKSRKGAMKDNVYTNAANALFWSSMFRGGRGGFGGGGFGGFSGGGGGFGGGGFSGRF